MNEMDFSDKPVLVSDGERKLKIDLQEISCIIVESVYCKFISRDNRVITKVRLSMGALSEYLSRLVFVRVSQSVIINIWDVDYIIGRIIYMRGGMFVEVSRRYARDVEEHFIVLKENRPQSEV